MLVYFLTKPFSSGVVIGPQYPTLCRVGFIVHISQRRRLGVCDDVMEGDTKLVKVVPSLGHLPTDIFSISWDLDVKLALFPSKAPLASLG